MEYCRWSMSFSHHFFQWTNQKLLLWRCQWVTSSHLACYVTHNRVVVDGSSRKEVKATKKSSQEPGIFDLLYFLIIFSKTLLKWSKLPFWVLTSGEELWIFVRSNRFAEEKFFDWIFQLLLIRTTSCPHLSTNRPTLMVRPTNHFNLLVYGQLTRRSASSPPSLPFLKSSFSDLLWKKP